MKTAQVEVDLRKRKVWIGETKYWYRLRHNRRTWYRHSKTYADTGDGIYKIKDLVALEHSEDGPPADWEPVERRIKDKNKLKQLDKILYRALEKEVRRRRHKRKLHQEKLESQNVASPQGDPPQLDDGLQKRTKWGVRINSSDGKHFFNLGCWRSTKYPGSASIRIGRYLYTVSQNDLKAMLEELQRGIQPEIPQKPI